ncbi:MAG: hypothetical protein AAGD43_06555 [Pseudomonadota bacterium]
MTTELHRVRTAEEGLALEAALFASSDPGVLVWCPQTRGIVCPAALIRKQGCKVGVEFEGWPIIPRLTGGGAVPQGPGVLNLALSYSVENGETIDAAYASLTAILRGALSGLELELEAGKTPASFCDGRWNLSCRGKKIVGTAQRWKARPEGGFRVLAHALILVEGDVQKDAQVIATLHRSLGLPTVDPGTHETLRSLKGKEMPGMAEISERLYRASWKWLQNRRPALAAA